MLCAWSVAGFTTYSGNQAIELKLVIGHRGRAVATETVAGFVTSDIPPEGFLHQGRVVQVVGSKDLLESCGFGVDATLQPSPARCIANQ